MPTMYGICAVCGTPFIGRIRTGRPVPRYCSRRCRAKEYNPILARESAIQRGDALRGRGEGRTYRKRGGKHEHRFVMEQYLGRKLLFTEVVHHKDGNRLNNDLDNLTILTRAEHGRHHNTGRRKARPIECCPTCQCNFTLNKHQVHRRKTGKSSQVFCSNDCYQASRSTAATRTITTLETPD